MRPFRIFYGPVGSKQITGQTVINASNESMARKVFKTKTGMTIKKINAIR